MFVIDAVEIDIKRKLDQMTPVSYVWMTRVSEAPYSFMSQVLSEASPEPKTV